MEVICILLLSSRSWLFPRCLIWPSQLHVIILDDAKMSGCCSHISSLKFTLSYTKREKRMKLVLFNTALKETAGLCILTSFPPSSE